MHVARKRTYYRHFLSICTAGRPHFTVEQRHYGPGVKGPLSYKPLLSGKDGSNHSRAIGDSTRQSQLAIIRTVNPIIAVIVNSQF